MLIKFMYNIRTLIVIVDLVRCTSRILILALICHQKREINLFSPFTTEILLSF